MSAHDKQAVTFRREVTLVMVQSVTLMVPVEWWDPDTGETVPWLESANAADVLARVDAGTIGTIVERPVGAPIVETGWYVAAPSEVSA